MSALGERNSQPAPNVSALGIMPAAIEIVVMALGRAQFMPGVDDRLVARVALARQDIRLAATCARDVAHITGGRMFVASPL